MYPHRIHLRGPWQCTPLASTVIHADGRIDERPGPVPAPCRMTMPASWAVGGLGPWNGRARFERRFHWPGRLDYYERVWLVFLGADYFARVWLNGEKLGCHAGAFDPFEFDITPFLQARNDLKVEVDSPALAVDALESSPLIRGRRGPDGGLPGLVALEVRREAFLRGVRFWAAWEDGGAMLHAAGEVVGPLDHPLELYLLVDGKTAAYEQVPCRVDGHAFKVQASLNGVDPWQPGQGGPAHEVRLELVDGASKLDIQVRRMGFCRLDWQGDPCRLQVNGRLVSRGADTLLCDDQPIAAWPDPLIYAQPFDDWLQQGRLAWFQLPFVGGQARDESFTREALRQVRAVIGRWQHLPIVAGWVVHTESPASNHALDQALAAALAEIDPGRPIR